MISGNPSSYIKINDAKSSGDLYAFYVNGKDTFGQSGTPSELLAAYGIDAAAIVEAAKKVIERK